MMNDDVVTANPFDTGEDHPVSGAVVAVEMQKGVAEVQAALVMARAYPRDPRRAMDRILQDCMRATLAEEATYQYSRGGTDISGPSIRLAETLAKRWGNMEAGVKELSRRDGVSECLAYAWDYETNYRDVRTFAVRHWRDTKTGGYLLKDERDIYEAIANNGARRKRACILALIDGDVIETAVRQCEIALAAKIEVTDELVAQMLERFGEYGVTKEAIERRIQRHMSALTPAMALSLKKIYNSLRDGMSAPSEWFEMGDTPAASVTQPAASRSRTDTIKARMKSRKARAAENVTDVDRQQAAAPAPTTAEAPTQGDNAGAPVFSFADVMTKIEQAATLDELNDACDLIRHVADSQHRKELTEAGHTRAARFND
ncbi:hypothetical protein R75461_07752 [Paraburkholderia nemoris]|uniref:hypothetical protein n=1 Tax=Paraburkholderia nemoris TaxID=2793076 RepID=UPI00190BE563|nr:MULTISPECIES: hypothetical protein [Paraburkholderia]MBK3786549.1 hypothetical protein [Paraburkholderia aspalathi]CAE6856758.1 hypothetical protein R75461_07752 [Paraburkholderia nemoris]